MGSEMCIRDRGRGGPWRESAQKEWSKSALCGMAESSTLTNARCPSGSPAGAGRQAPSGSVRYRRRTTELSAARSPARVGSPRTPGSTPRRRSWGGLLDRHGLQHLVGTTPRRPRLIHFPPAGRGSAADVGADLPGRDRGVLQDPGLDDLHRPGEHQHPERDHPHRSHASDAPSGVVGATAGRW